MRCINVGVGDARFSDVLKTLVSSVYCEDVLMNERPLSTDRDLYYTHTLDRHPAGEDDAGVPRMW